MQQTGPLVFDVWNTRHSFRISIGPDIFPIRPVAKNFLVGVLSLRVLGPGESEARRVEGDGGAWGGGLPIHAS